MATRAFKATARNWKGKLKQKAWSISKVKFSGGLNSIVAGRHTLKFGGRDAVSVEIRDAEARAHLNLPVTLKSCLLWCIKTIGAVAGMILAALRLWLTYGALQDSHCSTELAKWTAEKDCVDHCSQDEFRDDVGCREALKRRIPPPPKLLSFYIEEDWI